MRFLLLALIVACTFNVTCAVVSGEKRPNILFLVSEDNGPELGCYGDPYAKTPRLDQLAEEGVRFENAFVPYSVCSPSRACFLTGLFPQQNGQIGLATHKFRLYDENTPNIVTLLKSAGYRTGLIGKLHINPESAFPFDFRAIRGANFNRKQSVSDYAAATTEFLESSQGKPFFLSVNFPDAHLPFLKQANGRPEKPLTANDVKPMPWVGADSARLREQVANYYNCMERLDIGVGMVLDALQKADASDNTIVFYFGDHGAQFPRGKGTVYEGGLRVPLIVRWPNRAKAGTVSRELVSTVDILPTVLQVVGLPKTEDLQGMALQPLLEGKPAESWRQYNFGVTTGAYPLAVYVQLSVRDERYKLISSPLPDTINHDARTYLDPSHPVFVVTAATPEEQAAAPKHVQAAFERWSKPSRYELYDLKNDPHEWRDLSNSREHQPTKQRLIEALQTWQRNIRDPFLDHENIELFVKEQFANHDLKYRRDKSFAWKFMEHFKYWRAKFKADSP